MNKEWSVAEAKAKFSHLLENVKNDDPQIITKNGRPVAVVVSFDEWKNKTERSDTLADFFFNSPLQESGLEFQRIRDKPSPIEL
jgi:prevent-host-death family protein